MLFSEKFIDLVKENPIIGVINACQLIDAKISSLNLKSISNTLITSWDEEAHEVLWEGALFINVLISVNNFDVKHNLPTDTSRISTNCGNLCTYLKQIKKEFMSLSLKLKMESYTSRYETAFKSSFAYEFSQEDFDRIQILVNEIRNKISENSSLDTAHKKRLLKKLESLQSALHKRISDLDKFWGMVGDAGVVLSKLGTDAKPIVDRVKELVQIVWKTQARTEELPSNSQNPMLQND